MATIYATIGNSDDKLTQSEWSEFAHQFVNLVRARADTVHGVWWSAPDEPWQNCCIGFTLDTMSQPDPQATDPRDRGKSRDQLLREALTRLRRNYRQDAIAYSITAFTEMV